VGNLDEQLAEIDVHWSIDEWNEQHESW
jgi:hypothetical protein